VLTDTTLYISIFKKINSTAKKKIAEMEQEHTDSGKAV
jgi:hypothetical protein